MPPSDLISFTAVSETGSWEATGSCTEQMTFSRETVLGQTRVAELTGPLSAAPAQRRLLAAGPWAEIAVHSTAENAALWIECRLNASRTRMSMNVLA